MCEIKIFYLKQRTSHWFFIPITSIDFESYASHQKKRNSICGLFASKLHYTGMKLIPFTSRYRHYHCLVHHSCGCHFQRNTYGWNSPDKTPSITSWIVESLKKFGSRKKLLKNFVKKALRLSNFHKNDLDVSGTYVPWTAALAHANKLHVQDKRTTGHTYIWVCVLYIEGQLGP